ncbi:hypothetical protein KVF89_20865 [Nocardioides carbamazepini]|uniref:alpha-amylase family glycosyl hydrolase n=1 Tax=Nocardioides carbamazepini TaxID=2854259 RepID=UPI00214A2733|nr:alpha-amylase family glycosyl hydrolase [Nocardioides carbamazepini]MCR1785004.1 hypothetical protein [Nocardioides carbamazepini]
MSGLQAPSVVLQAYPDHVMPPNSSAPALWGLRWLLQRLPEGAFDALHLLPPYLSDADFGFAVVDYGKVDPMFGSWEDVRALAQETRLVLDFVVNHVSARHPWFLGCLSGDRTYQNRFITVDPEWDLAGIARPRSGEPVSTYRDAAGHSVQYWTTYGRDQVDLNYKNPGTLRAVRRQLADLLATSGAAGIRLDSLAFAWKEPPGLSIHADDTYRVAADLVQAVHESRAFAIAEVDDDLPIGKDYRERSMADAVYRYALPPLIAQALVSGTSRHLVAWLHRLPASRMATGINITATHDGLYLRPHQPALPADALDELVRHAQDRGLPVRYDHGAPYEINGTFADLLASADRNDTEVARHVAAQAIALLLPGIAQLYLPSLVGCFYDPALTANHGDARAGNRRKRLPLAESFQKDDSWEARVFSSMSSLLRVRHEHRKAFAPSSPFELQPSSDQVLAFSRSVNPVITVLVNLTDRLQRDHRSKRRRDLLSNGPASERLGPYQVQLLVDQEAGS